MKGARTRIQRLSIPPSSLLLFMIAHVWCVTCVSFSLLSPFLLPFGWTFRVSTASGESLAKYLTFERAQLRRDSETPNKRSGIGKDTVHYEIPPGNQRTETPPFTNAMNRAPFNVPCNNNTVFAYVCLTLTYTSEKIYAKLEKLYFLLKISSQAKVYVIF